MKNLLNAKWLLLINSVPILILLYFFWSEYVVLQSILSPESKSYWGYFGIGLALFGFLNLCYALFLISKKERVSGTYAILATVVYTGYIYLYCYNYNQLIPFNIPAWMLQDSPMLYLGSFLMPSIAYSIFVLVVGVTKEVRPKQALFNFLYGLAIPVGWYLLSQVAFPLFRMVESKFAEHCLIILFVISTLFFVFFCIRGIYIVSIKNLEGWKTYRLLFIIPISIVFPLLGLALNNRDLDTSLLFHGAGIFGDFSNPWFYIFAVLTGLSLCLPNLEHTRYRQLLFLARSLTFAYTLYFFFVFLPYLPLSIIAIILFGAGLLMLTPLALFVVHVNELYQDYQYLQEKAAFKFMGMASLLSFAALPIIISIIFLNDKLVLNNTLDYLYNSDYSRSEKINKNALYRTLKSLKAHKANDRDLFISSSHTPFLSAYYNWLVLDNLTLSNTKISRISEVFWGNKEEQNLNRRGLNVRREEVKDTTVRISQIEHHSKYDEKQQAWVSQVDLEITNYNSNSRLSEYFTNFELPEGCWISDYYLFVGDRKESGILAEKKSALWIYEEITRSNRDPGILYYLNGNQVNFKVFPFNFQEKRRTGLEFIHKEPFTLNLDDSLVHLGDSSAAALSQAVESADKKVVYVPAAVKAGLPKVQRKPYYHFLVDISKGADREEIKQTMEKFLARKLIASDNHKVSFVNSYVETIDAKGDWREALASKKPEGGFFLDRAFKSAFVELAKRRDNSSNSYPIFVVLSNSEQHEVLDNSYSDWAYIFPEEPHFYRLDNSGNISRFSLSAPFRTLEKDASPSTENPVLAYPDAQNPIAYLADDGKPSIVLMEDNYLYDGKDLAEKSWSAGLSMQGRWRSQLLHPENSEREWLNLVKSSFQTKLMMPVTSYIALENEAQKVVLLRKQEQVLKSNKSLDLGEDTPQMSEPGLWVLLLLLGGFWYYRQRSKVRTS